MHVSVSLIPTDLTRAQDWQQSTTGRQEPREDVGRVAVIAIEILSRHRAALL
jgi:hypothetical protein